MHSNCPEADSCGCHCHQQCPGCGKSCQVTYDLAKHLGGEERLVCHRCYRDATAGIKQRHCEGEDCEGDGHFAYRRPLVKGARYLCPDCHRKNDLN